MDVYKCSKERELATMETEIKTLFKITEKNKNDIKELSKIYDLTISVSVLAEQMKRNTEDISDIKSDVEEIKKRV